MTIRFGTEGWRAIMADEFTVENVRLVSQAIAEHVIGTAGRQASARMAVGYDTRFLSEHFARAVAEVLAANGLRVLVADRPVPTCAVSRAVAAQRLSSGVMVTASHNPALYNGLKVKASYGGSADTKTVEAIERRIGRAMVKRVRWEEAEQDRRVSRVNFLPRYLQGIRAFIDLKSIRRRPLRVMVDPMHGAAGRLVEDLVGAGRCRLETIHAEPDPLFGGQPPEPIAQHLGALSQIVRRRRADVGIATDGDADRLGIVGPDGTWLNPGQVMCVLLEHLVKVRGARGAIVKTVSNTMLIDRLADAMGLRLLEVPVGFKHIAQLMLQQDVLIGGEESGGIGVKGYLPERDGILNGLLLLEAIAQRGQKLSAILRSLSDRYGHWYYGRQDLHLTTEQVERLFRRLERGPPEALAGVPVARVNRLDGVKLIGGDESWLLFRRSGTEPIVRVYAETPQAGRLPRVLALGVRLAHGS